jgi:hypothetical protein
MQRDTQEEPEAVDQATPSVQRRTSDHIYAELDSQSYPSLRQGAVSCGRGAHSRRTHSLSLFTFKFTLPFVT